MFGDQEKRERLRAYRDQRAERLRLAREKGTHTALEWEVLKHICGLRCVRCGADVRLLEKDHIVPLYQGGSDSIDNIQPICARCNASKGAEAIDHRATAYPRWREHLLAIIESTSERWP